MLEILLIFRGEDRAYSYACQVSCSRPIQLSAEAFIYEGNKLLVR